jgi:filamentous hemagglutinin
VNDLPIGAPGSKERVDFGEIIGDYGDPVTSDAVPTSKGIIVYDRRRHAHIIPARP